MVGRLRDILMALRCLITSASIIWMGRMLFFIPTKEEGFLWLVTVAILIHYLERTVEEL